MKENTNEIKIESNTDNQKLENLIEKNDNILLDQKRKRIILDSTINDIDIEMKKRRKDRRMCRPRKADYERKQNNG